MSTVIRGKLKSVTDQTLYQPSEPLLLLFSRSVHVQLFCDPMDYSPPGFSAHGISQAVLVVKNPLVNAGDVRDASLIPRSGRSPGGGHGNPLQYSCLGNTTDRGAWWSTVHKVAKSRTRLK